MAPFAQACLVRPCRPMVLPSHSAASVGWLAFYLSGVTGDGLDFVIRRWVKQLWVGLAQLDIPQLNAIPTGAFHINGHDFLHLRCGPDLRFDRLRLLWVGIFDDSHSSKTHRSHSIERPLAYRLGLVRFIRRRMLFAGFDGCNRGPHRLLI